MQGGGVDHPIDPAHAITPVSDLQAVAYQLNMGPGDKVQANDVMAGGEPPGDGTSDQPRRACISCKIPSNAAVGSISTRAKMPRSAQRSREKCPSAAPANSMTRSAVRT